MTRRAKKNRRTDPGARRQEAAGAVGCLLGPGCKTCDLVHYCFPKERTKPKRRPRDLMFDVKTKRLYEPREPGDGIRVLVMRFWPRGVKKDSIDEWLRELGTDQELIRKWKNGRIRWREFREAYLKGLNSPGKREALNRLRELSSKGPVTLLCSCPDENRCHRGILKKLIVGGL